MNYNTIVCFDLEMCCWENGGPTGEIIEIGIAEICLLQQRVTRRNQYYVTPEHDKISDFCTQLTGITQSTINKQGRPLSEVLTSVTEKYGSNGKIYAAWGRDDKVLFDECDNKHITHPFKEYLNLSTMYKVHSRVKNKRFGLKKALSMEQLEFVGQPHSGYDDAHNLALLALRFL